MKVLFIYPGITLPGFNSLHTQAGNEATYISHGLMSLSAVLKQKGHKVFLLDMRDTTGWAHFETCLGQYEPDLIGISFFSCDARTAQIACSICKQVFPEVPIVGGGVHLSVTHAESFPYIDTIVHGEGEQAILELLGCIERGDPLPPIIDAHPILGLDVLPWVDRTLFDDEPERAHPLLPGLPAPNITIITSRGCPHRCSFCSPSGKAIFGTTLRLRDPRDVADELLHEANRKGAGSVMFHSDLFANKKWLAEFLPIYKEAFEHLPFWCQMRADFISQHPDMIEEMAAVGLLWVSLGLESGSQRMLDFLKKGTTVEQNVRAAAILHDNKVNIFANLLCGVPTETEEDMKASLEMAKQITPAWWSCNSWAAFPGSDLYQYVIDNDLLTNEHYSKNVYPYQRKIKGIDYAVAEHYQAKIRALTRPVEMPHPPVKKNDSLGPLVSVIMRSYNRPKMLRKAIESITAQSLASWELIIVDDASEDPSVATLLAAVEDSRIHTIRNTTNVDGHCIRLNQGLEAVRGKYVAFCDDDDSRTPKWMELMTQALEANPDKEFAICQSHSVNDGGSLTARKSEPPHQLADVLEANRIDLGEMVIRRSLFDRVGVFDERLRYGDDWEFVARLMKAEVPYVEVKRKLCRHTMHAGGQLNTRTEEQRDFTKHIIATKPWPKSVRVALYWPDPALLQYTQMEVVHGVRDALMRIPTVSVTENIVITEARPNPERCDLVIVVCPFQCPDTALEHIRSAGIQMVCLLTEDPPAFNTNLQKSRYFDWVMTNDLSTIPYYKEHSTNGGVPYTPNTVGYLPCLSINTTAVGSPIRRSISPKWDMIICGYMYPSRQAWFESVKDKMTWRRVLLIGRGWEAYKEQYEISGDLDPITTMVRYSEAKMIVCLHRQPSDDGTKIAFRSTSRAFREAYSGTPVVIENTREVCPPFKADEVLVFDYTNPDDFIEKARWVLDNQEPAKAMGLKAQVRARNEFTYTARMTRLIRDLRSPKYNIRIP